MRQARFAGRDVNLNRLLGRVDELNRLLAVVRAAVPPELAPHCLAVAWSGATLLVAVPGSAAAGKLRQYVPVILTKLQASGWHASAVLPRVQVGLQQKKVIRANNLQMTDQAMDAFSGLADSVSDPDLRQSLLRLLQHHGKPK